MMTLPRIRAALKILLGLAVIAVGVAYDHIALAIAGAAIIVLGVTETLRHRQSHDRAR